MPRIRNINKQKSHKTGPPPAQDDPTPAPGGVEGNAPPVGTGFPTIVDPGNPTLNGRPDHKKMDLWQYMILLNADQWQDTVGYLYRTSPTLSRRSLGKEGYLLRFFEPITEEWIKQNYGGREFRIDFVVRSNGYKLYTHRFGIVAQPKLQPGEEIAEQPGPATPAVAAAATAGASNQAEIFDMLRTMLADVLEQRNVAQESGKDFDVNSALDRSIALLSKGSNAAIDVVVEQSKKNPGGDGGAIALIMPLMLEMIKGLSKPKEDPVMAKLLEVAFQQRNAGDPLEQLVKFLDISDRVRGDGGGSSGSGWSGVAEKFLDRAPDILAQGKGVLDAAALARTAATPPAAPMLAPAAVGAAPSVTGRTTQTQPNPAPPAADIESVREQLIIDHLKATIATMALSGDAGDVAAQTADLIAPDYAAQLRQTMIENPMAIAADPILGQCRNAPNLRQFIHDFLQWFDEDNLEPAENAPEPEAGASAENGSPVISP